MSTTNRAFIKAYRQDTAEPKPIGGNSPVLQSPSGAPTREAAVRTTPSAGRPANSSVGQQQTVERRPLSSFIPSPLGRGTGEGALPLADAPSSRPSARVRGSELVQNESVNLFQPGTTVASFQWPRTCRTLSLQAGEQLHRVADLFRTQADAGHSLIGVMGLFPRVGTTTAAMCLASRAARRGPTATGTPRVILVDANFCHPRIASWLDAVPTVGWEEVLKHSAPLADAVIRSTDDNLDLLALGPKASRDPQPLASGLQAAVTAGVLRHAYDLVLIDLGTFFDSASQPIVLELVRNMGIDSLTAVAGPEPADPRDLATIAEYLQPVGCQLLGTIENRATKL